MTVPEPARTRRVSVFKDPASATTHFAGFLAALGAASVLVWRCLPDPAKVATMAVYGASLAGLFLASSTYHFFDLGAGGNRWLRRLDHAAIFGLIAGSYVPPVVHLLDGPWRIGMMAGVGAIALGGAVLKLAWIDAPRWLGMALYLGLGWLVLVPAPWILPRIPAAGLAWLAGGGLAYTLGALVYVRERPDPWPGRFGHHEVWHVLVLVGAACHYAFMLGLVETPLPPG